MRFQTLGSPAQPAAVLIHGSFCTAGSCMQVAEQLQDRFYVILPTLDGHGGEPEAYTTPQAQAAKILQYLRAQNIRRLALLQGSSMGAVVALEVARQNMVLQTLRGPEAYGLEIERTVLDGGAYFCFPQPVRWVLYRAMCSMVHGLQNPNREHAVDRTLYRWTMRSLFGKQPEPYRAMVNDMYDGCAGMSGETIRAVSDSCYRVTLPALDAETQHRVWFRCSIREMAYYMKKTLQKKYPEADFHDVDEPGHLYLQQKDPAAYAAYLCGILDGAVTPDPKPAPAEAKPQPETTAPAEAQPAAEDAAE